MGITISPVRPLSCIAIYDELETSVYPLKNVLKKQQNLIQNHVVREKTSVIISGSQVLSSFEPSHLTAETEKTS